MSDECNDLQVYETINAPLNQLLMQIEKTNLQKVMQQDIKLICYDALINNITERADEVSDWTFCNQKFKYSDALFGQVTLTDKSRQFLYHYYDVLEEIRAELISLRKEHLLDHVDEYPEYDDLIYEYVCHELITQKQLRVLSQVKLTK